MVASLCWGLSISCTSKLFVCAIPELLKPLWRSNHCHPTLQGRNGDLPKVSSWQVVALRAALEPGFSTVHLWNGQMWMAIQQPSGPVYAVPVPLNIHPPALLFDLTIVGLWCVVQFRAYSQWWAGCSSCTIKINKKPAEFEATRWPHGTGDMMAKQEAYTWYNQVTHFSQPFISSHPELSELYQRGSKCPVVSFWHHLFLALGVTPKCLSSK